MKYKIDQNTNCIHIFSCTRLPESNPCTALAGRAMDNSSPQTLPISVNEAFVALGLLQRQLNAPQACLEMYEHLICLVTNEPCDNTTNLPVLLCNETCQAYTKLIASGICSSLSEAIRTSLQVDFDPDVQVIIQSLNSFNCSVAETYFHSEKCSTQNTCTNLFSPRIQGVTCSNYSFCVSYNN